MDKTQKLKKSMPNMPFLFSIVLLAFTVFLVTFLIIFHKIKTNEWPYLKKLHLLTQAEKELYFILSEMLGNDYLIFSQVSMSALLYLPKMNNSNYYHYWNKIKSKYADFVICDKENIKPLLVIELDDSSHFRLDRIARDIMIDKIFENATLPILHIKFSSNYNKEDLLNQIKVLIV
jgi:hypothetical protein